MVCGVNFILIRNLCCDFRVNLSYILFMDVFINVGLCSNNLY